MAGQTTLRHIDAIRRVQRLRVSVASGPDADRSAWLDAGKVLAVGTAEDNELVLTDRLVSRYHLELTGGERGAELRDLGSSNGTFVGDVQLMHARVGPGQKIRLGGTVLVIDDAGLTEQPPADENTSIPGVIGTSGAMREVAEQVSKLARTQLSVLIRGETGTGKERIAYAIHELGPRKDKPFVVVDCGSMPSQLIASELFGHEKGAFTSADRKHIGAFERADGGTVFLDEIGELPSEVQPALLGVLERKRFRRVGGDAETTVDVRIVAATHRDLRAEVNRGTFRSDLYFRLAAARVVIPALRNRAEDIEPLVRHFVGEITGTPDLPFDAATIAALKNHRWTGNVRELRNVVETALAMGTVALDSAGESLAPARVSRVDQELRPYKDERTIVLDRFEKEYLSRLMRACDNNASEAARRAKMDRGYLLSLLRRHNLRG